MLWFQKSREKWVELGDRNTKYFHTSTIIRRCRNRIEALKDNEDRWVVNAHAFLLPLGFHSFPLRPDFATSIIFEDASSATRPRNVRV